MRRLGATVLFGVFLLIGAGNILWLINAESHPYPATSIQMAFASVLVAGQAMGVMFA